MATIYHRYFKTSSEKLVEKISEILTKNADANTALHALAKEVGAKDGYKTSRGAFVGFSFDGQPDSNIWKKPNRHGLYMPKKSSKEGKVIFDKINGLPKARDTNEALALFDIPAGPTLMDARAGRIYGATLAGSVDKKTFFIKMPWKDFDPEVLEKYKKDRADGVHFSAEMSYVLWDSTKHPDLVEVKEWEMMKALDEMEIAYR